MIQISLQFALLLKDDFSGATIADGGQRFFVDDRPVQPVRKPEGFFAFVRPPGAPPESKKGWRVRIESARYQTRTLHLRPDDLPPGQPLHIVQMYRKPHSGFTDCTWLEAAAPPGMLGVALLDDGETPLTLRGFGADGKTLSLCGYTTANLLWRRVCVGKGKRAELFTLTEKGADGSYTVDRPPRRSHKEGESVRLAACGPADAAGRCTIPLGSGWQPLSPTVLAYDEEVRQWRETLSAPARR